MVIIILSWWFLIRASTRYSSIDKDPQGPTLYSYHICRICGMCIVYEISLICPRPCETILQSASRNIQLVLILSLGQKVKNIQSSNRIRACCSHLNQIVSIRLISPQRVAVSDQVCEHWILNDRIILNFICQIEMTLRWPQMTYIIYFSNLDFKFRNENAKWFFLLWDGI